VVFFHGGEEWSTRPDAGTRALYRDLVEGGADLVIGTHPHVAQGFEWHNGKAIFWSLGNYVFGGMDGTAGGEDGLFISLGYSGSTLVYLEPAALALKNNRAAVVPPERLETFYARSTALAEEKAKEEES
jgi:poly-gamma-glutamate synthesis protein (capsule biosynthesis protein)